MCELYALLGAAPPQAPLAERMAWLEQLTSWLRTRGPVPSWPGRLPPVESSGSARLRLLVEVLREVPAWCEAVRGVFTSVLAETSALRLLSDLGVSPGRGLFGDFVEWLSQKVVPPAPDERNLAALVWRLFPGPEGARWLDEVSAEQVAAFCELMSPSCFDPLKAGVEDAVAVLAVRVSALGLGRELLARLPRGRLGNSPFTRLPLACEALRQAVHASAQTGVVEQHRQTCAELLAACRTVSQSVLHHMDEHAVDTDLVYRLELLGHALDRLEALLWLLAPDMPHSRSAAATRLLSSLVHEHAQGRTLANLIRGSVRPISRRIFEHTGAVGRHYITTGRDDYHRLVRAAAGGGVLTASTAALKLLITFAALPLFFDGLAASTNYAVSFLLIQLLGFTLATKQPSMTAAAVAASMDVKAGDQRLRSLVQHLACVTRSQLASVFGNLCGVVATVTLGSIVLQSLRGQPLLTVSEAEYVIHSLNPLKSGTIVFAALTGVLLWCSSVFGGWLENWVSYRRLPEALASHRGIILLLGEERARWLGAAVARNACGLGANVSLGLLLGMTPAVSKFFGLPLDVRHVTLSAGTLAFAGTALGPARLLSPDFLWAVAGIGVVGVMNLSVSFSLGLSAATRSRGLEPVGFLRLVRAVFAGGFRSLAEFILPPRPPLLPARRPTSRYGVISAARPRYSAREQGSHTEHH